MPIGSSVIRTSVFEIISDACKELKKTVYLTSGAISGIDAIKSVKNELDSVVLTTTKHPNSLKGAKFFDDFKINLDEINEPSTIFEGTASEAVRLFPKNINVSALLSISGLGSHETIVKIIADPTTTKNTHEIAARGKFGQITTKIEKLIGKFIEKPDLAKAKYLVNKNAFWNTGITVVKNDVFNNLLKRFAPKLYNDTIKACKGYKNDREFIIPNINNWKRIKSISLDYALLEKNFKRLAIPLKTYWSDLGTYDSLYKIKKSFGNVISLNTNNSFTYSNFFL